jgi:hypothetical protein
MSEKNELHPNLLHKLHFVARTSETTQSDHLGVYKTYENDKIRIVDSLYDTGGSGIVVGIKVPEQHDLVIVLDAYITSDGHLKIKTNVYRKGDWESYVTDVLFAEAEAYSSKQEENKFAPCTDEMNEVFKETFE